jgi:hypothetical protein
LLQIQFILAKLPLKEPPLAGGTNGDRWRADESTPAAAA